MRVMLMQLIEHAAAALLERLRHRLPQVTTDDAQAKLFATLGFVEEALPEALKPLLVPLALHERFIDADDLEAMARIADASYSRAAIEQVLISLEIAGLLHAHSRGIYTLHPALTGFLRARPSASDATATAWERAFVDVMGRLADQVAPKSLHVQRPFFALHSANFHAALTAAEHVEMDLHGAALAQTLAAYAENQRDFAQAEQWYRKSLAISEKQGNEHGAASTYHQLGIIAQEQRDSAQAGQWYIRSIVIYLRYNDRYSLRIAAQSFLRCYAQAPPAIQATLKALWENAGLGPLPAENAQE
jgi:tetratricopeptide (TPR) repeat protein